MGAKDSNEQQHAQCLRSYGPRYIFKIHVCINFQIKFPAPQKKEDGPDLMGDWSASNILSSSAGATRANFSNMQQSQQQSQQSYDPFANLTSMGSSLPKPSMNQMNGSNNMAAGFQPARPQQQQQQQYRQPQQQQSAGMAGGAWGATFQTRPAANPGQASGGWNPNAYMQVTSSCISELVIKILH